MLRVHEIRSVSLQPPAPARGISGAALQPTGRFGGRTVMPGWPRVAAT